MSEDTRPPPSHNGLDDIKAAIARVFAPLVKAWREAYEEREQKRRARLGRAAAYAKRPPGWSGHWSERYGRVLVRTLNLEPPFTQSQSEMLGAIPRPLQEALDAAASVAEPMDREGNLVAWRLARCTTLDFFGPAGLALAALALAIVAFTIVVPRLGFPPLMAPAAAPQPPQAQPQQPTATPQPRPPERRPQPPQEGPPLELPKQNQQQELPQSPGQPQQQQQQQNQEPVGAPPQQSPQPPASAPASGRPRS
jgi:hypothetical protein